MGTRGPLFTRRVLKRKCNQSHHGPRHLAADASLSAPDHTLSLELGYQHYVVAFAEKLLGHTAVSHIFVLQAENCENLTSAVGRMQVVGKREPIASGSNHAASLSLSFYQSPPEGEMTLDQFEGAALDRLSLLQTIEQALQGAPKDIKAKIDEKLAKVFPHDDVDRDTVGHYAMRLAYARPQDRAWFLKHETALFQHRLEKFEAKALTAFLKHNKMSFPQLKQEEFEAARDDLKEIESAVHAERAVEELTHEHYFRVRFTEALDLFRSRQVYLHQGWLYVHQRLLVSIISARFRTLLSEALAHTYRALPQQQSDERFTPLLSALTRRAADVDYRALALAPGERVRPADLDALAQKSYPLCMQSLHKQLRSSHHLKHGGRLQYGLFLKGIGLSLEDALEFWRAEFTRKMPLKTFESSYSYNIRHNYGKEGKGTDYTPYACVKIISQKPGPEEHHGCPFRCWEKSLLKSTINAAIGKEMETQAIVDEAMRDGNPQGACSRFFVQTHPGSERPMVNHPNNYFRHSRAHWAAQSAKPAAAAPAALPAAAAPPAVAGGPLT